MKDLKHIKKFNESTENLNISAIIKELEDLQWKLHLQKETGETSEDYFSGYGMCLFKLKSILKGKANNSWIQF